MANIFIEDLSDNECNNMLVTQLNSDFKNCKVFLSNPVEINYLIDFAVWHPIYMEKLANDKLILFDSKLLKYLKYNNNYVLYVSHSCQIVPRIPKIFASKRLKELSGENWPLVEDYNLSEIFKVIGETGICPYN